MKIRRTSKIIFDKPYYHKNNSLFDVLRIAPYSNMQVNESILNQAAIFFDFTAPVITKHASTTLITPTGIVENVKNHFVVYPNPNNTGIVNVAAANNFTELRFYNMLGALVKSQKVSGNRVNANVSDLFPGVYFVQLIGDEGNNIGIQKFVRH